VTRHVLRFATSSYAPHTRQVPHTHDELQVSVILRGAVRERVGTDVEEAGALSVVVKDPGVAHADEFGPGPAVVARLAIAGVVLADIVDAGRGAEPWRWSHQPAAAAPFLRMVRRATSGTDVFDAADDDVTDLLSALTARRASVARGNPPAWLRDVTASIGERWTPGTTVRDVALAAGVHPVYLARCVRRWHGVSAADLLRRARLRHAAAVVARADGTVSRAAHAAGYADEPHLCRDFASAYGVTPGRYRRLAAACAQRAS
jgi:AraC family transcriptional regulator